MILTHFSHKMKKKKKWRGEENRPQIMDIFGFACPVYLLLVTAVCLLGEGNSPPSHCTES